MFARTREALRAAREYQRIHRPRWLSIPIKVLERASYLFYTGILLGTMDLVIFRHSRSPVAWWIERISDSFFCAFAIVLAGYILFQCGRNTFRLARIMSDPTYENE